jgi:hypothetical protein
VDCADDPADLPPKKSASVSTNSRARAPIRGVFQSFPPSVVIVTLERVGADHPRRTHRDRLRREVIDIEHQYVDCWQNYTRFRTIYPVLGGIGQTLEVHRQSTPERRVCEHLAARLKHLQAGAVDTDDLVIEIRLSKHSEEYSPLDGNAGQCMVLCQEFHDMIGFDMPDHEVEDHFWLGTTPTGVITTHHDLLAFQTPQINGTRGEGRSSVCRTIVGSRTWGESGSNGVSHADVDHGV